jgi:hypothetical protein
MNTKTPGSDNLPPELAFLFFSFKQFAKPYASLIITFIGNMKVLSPKKISDDVAVRFFFFFFFLQMGIMQDANEIYYAFYIARFPMKGIIPIIILTYK